MTDLEKFLRYLMAITHRGARMRRPARTGDILRLYDRQERYIGDLGPDFQRRLLALRQDPQHREAAQEMGRSLIRQLGLGVRGPRLWRDLARMRNGQIHRNVPMGKGEGSGQVNQVDYEGAFTWLLGKLSALYSDSVVDNFIYHFEEGSEFLQLIAEQDDDDFSFGWM